MKTVGLIPARGRSETIPLKNMHPFGGKPLMQWVIEAGQQAGLELWCSTENEDIAAFARTFGVNIHRRSPETARQGRIKDTLREFIREVDCDAIVLLQPTSPFVRPKDIASVELTPGWNSAQTIVKCQHNAHELNQRAVDEEFVRFVHEDRETRKQDKPERYQFGNVVAFRTQAFLAQNEVFATPSRGIEIPWVHGFDADGPEEFKAGELLLPLIDAS